MQIYRARSSLIWGWVSVGLGIVFALLNTASAGLAGAGVGLGLGAAAVALGFAAFLRPHVAVGADRVEMHNVLGVATMRFARLESLDTRWTLEAVGDDGRRAGAFAAPAPGAVSAGRQARRAASEEGPAAFGPPGSRAGTASGDASIMVRAAWDAWKSERPAATVAQDDAAPSVEKRPDLVGIALVVVGVAAAAWGLFS